MKGSGIGTELKRVQKRDGTPQHCTHGQQLHQPLQLSQMEPLVGRITYASYPTSSISSTYLLVIKAGDRGIFLHGNLIHRPQGCSSMAKEEQCGTNESFWKAALYAASPAVGERRTTQSLLHPYWHLCQGNILLAIRCLKIP